MNREQLIRNIEQFQQVAPDFFGIGILYETIRATDPREVEIQSDRERARAIADVLGLFEVWMGLYVSYFISPTNTSAVPTFEITERQNNQIHMIMGRLMRHFRAYCEEFFSEGGDPELVVAEMDSPTQVIGFIKILLSPQKGNRKVTLTIGDTSLYDDDAIIHLIKNIPPDNDVEVSYDSGFHHLKITVKEDTPQTA